LAEINWTRESEIWLKDIHDFIALDDSEAAARTITGIYKKAQLLKQHPQLGHRYEGEKTRHVRILLYEHYRITYLIKPDGNWTFLGSFTER
jgi:toxin ParE1/3/4